MDQHTSGRGAVYTSRRLPVELVFVEEFDNIGDAFEREKQVQGWSRKKREALIAGDYDALIPLSRRHSRYERLPKPPATE